MTRRVCHPALLLLTVTSLTALGCGAPAPAKAVAAATVTNPQKEADLTSVVLTTDAERRLGIETMALGMQDMGGERRLGGELQVPPGRSIPVTAPVAGRVDGVEGVRLSAGLSIRQQQVVLRLTPLSAPARDLRVTYEAEQVAAKARLDGAQQQLDRARQMLKDQVGSQRGLEQALQEHAQAKAAHDAARGRLDRIASQPLDADISLPVTAPLTGTIRQLLASPGQVVAAGATLFELENLTVLWVRVPVYVGELTAFRAAKEAVVDMAGGPASQQRRSARRVAGPPTADPQASSADLFFELDNRDGAFRAGQRVSVSVPSATTSPGLTIPAAAVAYDYHGGAWVYVNTAPQTYVRRRVEVARTVGSNVVLARGPEAGARLVTAGVAELFGTEFGAGK